jgi:hypothetical protein
MNADIWFEISLNAYIGDVYAISHTCTLLNNATKRVIEMRNQQLEEVRKITIENICSRGNFRSESWTDAWIGCIRADKFKIEQLQTIKTYIIDVVFNAERIDLPAYCYDIPRLMIDYKLLRCEHIEHDPYRRPEDKHIDTFNLWLTANY